MFSIAGRLIGASTSGTLCAFLSLEEKLIDRGFAVRFSQGNGAIVCRVVVKDVACNEDDDGRADETSQKRLFASHFPRR